MAFWAGFEGDFGADFRAENRVELPIREMGNRVKNGVHQALWLHFMECMHASRFMARFGFATSLRMAAV